MVVQMLTDKQLHEINQYSDTAFPVGLYVVTKDRIIPKGRGHLDLHWHEELQFTLVTNGSVTMQVSGEIYKLQEGEAIFINRNLLHITPDFFIMSIWKWIGKSTPNVVRKEGLYGNESDTSL